MSSPASKSGNETNIWITFNKCALSKHDKDIILKICYLEDRHIGFGQCLLQNQFPKINGFQSTLYQTESKYNIKSETIARLLKCKMKNIKVNIMNVNRQSGVHDCSLRTRICYLIMSWARSYSAHVQSRRYEKSSRRVLWKQTIPYFKEEKTWQWHSEKSNNTHILYL